MNVTACTPLLFGSTCDREPSTYLVTLASRLLEEMLLRCDREAQKVALETSNESNLAFYERFGFVTTDELLLDEGLKIWLMCR
ncbi:MAG: GNAT family N-acetyltransferase [Planctomycetes bacterium]|nr:GNAT family N-acetyltransferase [Planctomycetota bacterium]